jgi:hypothetical protein
MISGESGDSEVEPGMGNYRSGRRYFVDAKTTVEDCRSLDIAQWAREGLTGPGGIRTGVWQWRDSSRLI